MSLTKLKAAALTLLVGANLIVATPALAQSVGGLDQNQVCSQWQIDQGFCKPNFRSNIQSIINIILGFLGLIAFAFLVYGGFLYLTAGANEENVDKAKKIIIYAVIGMVLIFLAYGLVFTVIKSLGAGQEAAGTTK